MLEFVIVYSGYFISIEQLPLCYVSDSVQYCRSATEAEVAQCIRSFLRNAPDRQGGGGRPTKYQIVNVESTDDEDGVDDDGNIN